MMNSMHNNGNDRDPVQNDLDKLAAGAYARLPSDEPPELLDLAILNSAHRAISKRPGWVQFGWLHGLTTTAVVVLTLSVIMLQQPTQTPGGIELHDDEAVILDQVQAGRENAASEPVTVSAHASDEPVKQQKARKDAKRQRPSVRAPSDRSQILEKRGFEESAFVDEGILESKPPVASVEADLSATTAATGSTVEFTFTRAEAQQMVAEILKLKQAGNDAWETELQKFINVYPNYPLPEELRPRDQIP